jgi:hypothetical protein
MRLRTFAALALVTVLLASPVSAFACGFECWPASTNVAVKADEASVPEGDCHRELEDPIADSFALSAAPHDCAAPSAVPGTLSHPKGSTGLQPGIGATASSSSLRFAINLAPARNWVGAQDLAPPAHTPALIAPLRI